MKVAPKRDLFEELVKAIGEINAHREGKQNGCRVTHVMSMPSLERSYRDSKEYVHDEDLESEDVIGSLEASE